MLYEFYYSIQQNKFQSIYFLDVDRETEKMIYGFARNVNNHYAARFATRKDSIDVVEATHEYVYRIRTKGDSFDEAFKNAKVLISNFLLEKARVVTEIRVEVSK